MPQVIAAAVVGALKLTGVAATIATAAIQTVAYAGITMGISALTAPPQVGREGSPTEWRGDPESGSPFAIGRIGTAGKVVHRDAYGPDNRYQSFVSVLSGAGPIDGYESFFADDVEITFSGELAVGKLNNWMWRQTRLGEQPDTALTIPSGLEGSPVFPGWTSNHKLSGKAATLWTLRQNGDFTYYPAGEPKPLNVIRGIKSYDPRLDSTYPGGSGSCRLLERSTWVYSTNPAIHALNWALGLRENGLVVGGLGVSFDGIDAPAFVEAANIADANGWTVAGVPTTADDEHQVLAALLQAAGAVPARKAGKLSCVSRAAPRTSVATISVNDTAGPVEFTTGSSRIGRINAIVPRCVQEDQNWQMVSLGEVSADAYIDEDGGKRQRSFDYPYVTDADQAAQLAAYDIADSREGITGDLPLKPYMRDLETGDAFTITEPGFVLDGLKCLVVARSYDPETDIVTVTFRSETDGKHDWAMGRTASPPPTPSLSPVDPTEVSAPPEGGWVLSAGPQATLVITGASTNAQAAQLVVDYRVSGDTDWTSWREISASVQRIDITGLEPLTAYQVSLRYRSILGVLSEERLILGPVTTGSVSATDVGGTPAEEVLASLDQTAEALMVDILTKQQQIVETRNLSYLGDKPASYVLQQSILEEAETRAEEILAEAAARAAAVTAEQTARQDADESLAEDITLVTAALEDEVDARIAAVASEATARADADSAEATARQTLASQVRGAYTGTDIASVTTGLLYSARTTWASADAAMASDILALEADVGDAMAAITSEATTRATEDSALASDITTLSASVDDLDASVTTYAATIADIESGLLATWGVMVDVGGRISGIQLLTVGGAGTTTSYLDFEADVIRFWNGSSTVPLMELSGGDVYVGGELVRTQSMIENAATLGASVASTSTITQVNSASFGNQILELTMTTFGGPVFLNFSAAWQITDQQELWFYVHIDSAFNWTGSAETNHQHEIPVETSSTGTVQNVTSFCILTDALSAGSHTFRIYIRNTTGSSVDIHDRTLFALELRR
ncbi:MAG: hypothetical protein KA105_02840 [Caulobacter sp.]|nr:hypothetical protein [Caulobacter sp.]